MEFLRKLAQAIGGSPASEAHAYWIHVRCSQCGEKLRTRVDLRNDLSEQYEPGGGRSTYFCRKTLVGGSGCYRRIEVELTFDQNRRLLDHEVEGGEWISADEYSSA